MGVPVFSFGDFEAKFEQRKKKKNLFGFFLYDSRPTHKIIEEFTKKRSDWLDELAGFGGIYFFFPLRETSAKEFENPSLEVAKLFDISLSALPGIVLFTLLPSDTHTNKVVYFELEEQIFDKDPKMVEKIFNGLFEILRKCQKEDKSPDELLEDVRNEVERLQRSGKMQLFVRYLKKGAAVLFIDLPEKMLTAMAEGFGKSLGEQAGKN